MRVLAAWHAACFQPISSFEVWLAQTESILTLSRVRAAAATVAIINNEHDTQGAGKDVFNKQVCDPQKQLEAIVMTFR